MNQIGWTQRKQQFLLISVILLIMAGCAQAAFNPHNNDENDPQKRNKQTTVNNNRHNSQVGNVLFNLPPGWQRFDQDGGALFIPGNASTDNPPCTIGILPGQGFDGDFRGWFNNLLANITKGSKVLVKPEITETKDDDNAYPIFLTQMVLQDSNGQVSYRFYVAAHPGNRLEAFAFFAPSESAYKEYLPVFTDFLKSVDFENYLEAKNGRASGNNNNTPTNRNNNNNNNENNTANSRPAVGNGLSGFYVGSNAYNRYNAFTHFNDYVVDQLHYLFFPDGRVYYGVPLGGSLDNVSFEQLQRTNPQGCGHYQFSGNQIQFQFGDNEPYTRAFTKTAYGFTLGNIKLYRVDKFDNYRLDGVYGQGTYVGTGGPGGTGSVAGDHKIIFSRDGRFQKSDFVGFAGSGSDVNSTTSESRAGQGTYQINGNTLELRYNDGRRERLTFYVYPENVNESTPGLIVIDGGSYLLRK